MQKATMEKKMSTNVGHRGTTKTCNGKFTNLFANNIRK